MCDATVIETLGTRDEGVGSEARGGENVNRRISTGDASPHLVSLSQLTRLSRRFPIVQTTYPSLHTYSPYFPLVANSLSATTLIGPVAGSLGATFLGRLLPH